tara:strand:- start:680 stop:1372 length:693 start_codon:yes stop_codon:yes gene_type:complete
MNYRIVLILIAVIFTSGKMHSQWTDYGGWTSATVTKKVAKKTYASANYAMRWDRDFTRLGTTFLDADISREIVDDINFTISLRVGVSKTDEYQWEPQRRFSTNARYKIDLGKKSSISLRAQYQTGHKGASTPGQGIEFSNAFRSKFTYSYRHSKKYKFSLSAETFFRPIYSFYALSDYRARISVRKKLAKRKYLSLGYQVETPRGGPDPWVEHAIICNFSLDMKRRKSEK